MMASAFKRTRVLCFGIPLALIGALVTLTDKQEGWAAQSPHARSARVARGNLVRNAGFSQEREYWSSQGDGQHAINVTRAGLAFQKEGFFRLYQDIDVAGPGVYLLKMRVMNQASRAGTAALVIPFSDGEWTTEAEPLLVPHPNRAWQDCRKTIYVGRNVTKVRLALQGTPEGIVFGQVFFGMEFARQPVNIPLASARVTVDGIINETAWRRATSLSDFRVLADVDQVAKPATFVKVLSDEGSLLVAFAADEPRISNLTSSARDSNTIRSADHVAVFVSPDAVDSYEFLVDVHGNRRCIQRNSERHEFHQTWFDDNEGVGGDYLGPWEAAAKKLDGKYLVEMRIPLSDLVRSNSANKQVLFIDFARRRTLGEPEFMSWGGLPRLPFYALDNLPEFRLTGRLGEDGSDATEGETPPPDTITAPLGEPRFLIAGRPLAGKLREGKSFPLPGELRFQEDGATLSDSVREFVKKGLTASQRTTTSTMQLGIWEEDDTPLPLADRQIELCRSDEAFVLEVQPDAIRVAGRTQQGVLRGVATVCMLGSQAKSRKGLAIPCLTMVDGPRSALRGWDLSGGSEIGHAKDLLDILFLLRMNYAVIDLVGYGDDPRFPFDSHPKLGGKRYTKQEYQELARYARERGINLIPQLNIWSRAGWILNKPDYEYLAAEKERSYPKSRKFERSFNAFHPDAPKLVFDLLDEVIDTMEPTDIHVNLDELHFAEFLDSESPHAQGKTKLDWITHVVRSTRDHLKARGVRMWMWADEIDPYHNGRHNGIADPGQDGKKLDSLPRDIILNPWRYGFPERGRFPSIRFFHDLGFGVVPGCSWYRAENVALSCSDVTHFRTEGIFGTTWGNPHPTLPYKQVMTGMSLAAYMGWSPEDCCVEAFPFISTLLYQQAAFRYGREKPCAVNSTPIPLADAIGDDRSKVVAGERLKQAMGLPDGTGLGFLSGQSTNYRGVVLEPFTDRTQPAALHIRGDATAGATIPIGKTARFITLMHATSKVSGYEGKNEYTDKHFRDAVPATYVLFYEDGTSHDLPLDFRTHITDWNDIIPGKLQEPVVFGNMRRRLHINIPALTWENPFPEKAIKSLQLLPGNRDGMDVLIYAISLDGPAYD